MAIVVILYYYDNICTVVYFLPFNRIFRKRYMLKEKIRRGHINSDGTYHLVDSTTMDSVNTRKSSDFTTTSLQLSYGE